MTAGPAAPRGPELTADELIRRLRDPGELTPAEAAALARLDGDPDDDDARVECWAEPAGTGAIAGRDLNLAAVIAVGRHLDSAARWLKRHGAPGSTDQLRAPRPSWPAWPASPSHPSSPRPPQTRPAPAAAQARTRPRPAAPATGPPGRPGPAGQAGPRA